MSEDEKNGRRGRIGQVPRKLKPRKAISEAIRLDQALEACAEKSSTSRRLVGQCKAKLVKTGCSE